MTEAAESTPDAAAFVRLWAEALSQALGQITSGQVPCAVLEEAPDDVAGPANADLWMVCTCSVSLRGEMSFRLSPAGALRLAQSFMGEPAAPEAELTGDHREAVVELFRQVAGLVATSVKPGWGEVKFQMELSASAPTWTESSTSWLRAGGADTLAIVELHLSAALAASLRTEARRESPNAAADAPPATSPGPPPPSDAIAGPVPGEDKLGLLLDVELEMTLRFGSRRLLLREVLDLCPGAVVELDRQVDHPVDLILDGKLVARGEVVVIEGNYGFRVTEISPARTH